MKIIPIFAPYIYTVVYSNTGINAYRDIMETWIDQEKLLQFLQENRKDMHANSNIYGIVDSIVEESYQIERSLLDILNVEPICLDKFFRQLDNREFRIMHLSLRKGKTRYLRLYAVRIDMSTYVITGGAIKLPLQHLMQDRQHTSIELYKLQQVKLFLEDNGIFDEDSFYEFLNT